MAKHDNINVISQIRIPAAISGAETDIVYDIHDPKAIHELTDLGLSTVLDFKGVVEKYTDLPTTNNKIGDVYHVKNEDYEYVWIDSNGDGIGDTWEEFGAAHDFVGTKDFEGHTHEFTPGSVTIPDLTVTGTVPAYEASKTKLSASTTAPTLTGSSPETVIKGDATMTVSAITSVSTTPTTIKAEGTAATWSASVTNGVLTFAWTPNTPAVVNATVVGSVTGNTESVNVSVPAAGKTNINTAWTASAPATTLKSGSTGDVSVATEVSPNGTNSITNGKAKSTTVNITGGTVGSVELPTSNT